MTMSSSKSSLTSPSLSIYSDWLFCDGCGLPPRIIQSTEHENNENENNNNNDDDNVNNMNKESQQRRRRRSKKLLICRKCKTSAYHDSQCQKIHWVSGHRNACKKQSVAIQPLLDIIAASYNDNDNDDIKNNYLRRRCSLWWWKRLSRKDIVNCNKIWKTNVSRWNRDKEYLEAMEGFQKALEPIMKIWNGNKEIITSTESSLLSSSSTTRSDQQQDVNFRLGIQLARKLLFCAYCEADGNLPDSSRSRLAQCISILLELLEHSPSSSSPSLLVDDDDKQREHEQGKQQQQRERERNYNSDIITPILNDAWMELMLSYEEVSELRKISYHVAHMAIQSGNGRCEWNDPLQRPGFMAKFPVDNNNDNNSPLCFFPPETHPGWCKILENNWKEIEAELYSLLHQTDHINTSSSWAKVGCGNRGSGSDDHRVVSTGDWMEYVLFGTGAASCTDDDDAPITKRLLRNCVGDAVSLAESGGGEIIFSRLAPHTHIDAHCGPTNLRLTAHLALLVPDKDEDCKIRIKNNWYYWETGKILLFDDSYEHEIRNDTDQVRIVLLIRFWHPLISCEQQQLELSRARRRKEMSIKKRYHPPI